MEIRFNSCQGVGSIVMDYYSIERNIEVIIDENTEIYKTLTKEIDNGIISLKSFKNPGVPGKVKYNRRYKYKEDFLELLKRYEREYYIFNIAIITRSIKHRYRLVEIHKLVLNKLPGNKNCIKEYDDRYEYCIAEEYEKKYAEFEIERIQLDKVFIKLVTIEEEKLVVSLEFMKELFDMKQTIDWLILNEIKILKDKENYLKDAFRIVYACKFNGKPIIIFIKGEESILINRSRLIELNKEFNAQDDEIGIFDYKGTKGPKSNKLINLNGYEINFIPEIDLDLGRDLIFSNGQLIVASYIGDYGGSIGFFEKKEDEFPMILLLDEVEDIYINIYTKGNQRRIVVEYSIEEMDVNKYFF